MSAAGPSVVPARMAGVSSAAVASPSGHHPGSDPSLGAWHADARGPRPVDLFGSRHAGLPELDHPGRVAGLLRSLAGQDVDVAVISKLVNVRYLCGFTGSHALFVVGRHGALTLVTDGRYRDQATRQLAEAGVAATLRVETAKFDEAVAEVIRDSAGLAGGQIRLGLEADGVSWAEQRRYAAQFPNDHLEPLSGLVEAMRARKEPGEIARMELAAHIADQALSDVIGRLHEEPTERDFALELEVAMRQLGADGPSFETIVASGPNGALPHARPGARRIERGDLVVLDFGALVAGYHSDMTRTVCVGPADAAQRRQFDVVRRAQQQARDAVRAGVVTKDIDAVARQVIDDAGWGEQFTHGTGHGIGLDVHESPILSRTTTAELRTDYVVTVEPGVYLVGSGGVRVEDQVVVGPNGCRSLTRFPKELEV